MNAILPKTNPLPAFQSTPQSIGANADLSKAYTLWLKPVRKIGRILGRWLVLALVLLGACAIYEEAIGDGPMPRFNGVIRQPELLRSAHRNSTRMLPVVGADYWQALGASRRLLTVTSPEIASWLYGLRQQGRLEFTEPRESVFLYAREAETSILAAYRPLNGKLYIGSSFWSISDGEKAAVLAHEYRHARQSFPKRLRRQVAQLLTWGRFRYQSTLEAEAFDYERQARFALGLSPLGAGLYP